MKKEKNGRKKNVVNGSLENKVFKNVPGRFSISTKLLARLKAILFSLVLGIPNFSVLSSK
tara:strand:+ start:345 stop:524 length:180 start_codon:yes stop_codon:yes gene_type:complete